MNYFLSSLFILLPTLKQFTECLEFLGFTPYSDRDTEAYSILCDKFDYDESGIVDLKDFAKLQNKGNW